MAAFINKTPTVTAAAFNNTDFAVQSNKTEWQRIILNDR
jgi:hypothetical protein